MAPAETQVAERNRSEIAAAEAEVRRLQPEADDAVIHDLVQTFYDELVPAKVHSYVTILIVHQVRDILRNRQPAA